MSSVVLILIRGIETPGMLIRRKDKFAPRLEIVRKSINFGIAEMVRVEMVKVSYQLQGSRRCKRG